MLLNVGQYALLSIELVNKFKINSTPSKTSRPHRFHVVAQSSSQYLWFDVPSLPPWTGRWQNKSIKRMSNHWLIYVSFSAYHYTNHKATISFDTFSLKKVRLNLNLYFSIPKQVAFLNNHVIFVIKDSYSRAYLITFHNHWGKELNTSFL